MEIVKGIHWVFADTGIYILDALRSLLVTASQVHRQVDRQLNFW